MPRLLKNGDIEFLAPQKLGEGAFTSRRKITVPGTTEYDELIPWLTGDDKLRARQLANEAKAK